VSMSNWASSFECNQNDRAILGNGAKRTHAARIGIKDKQELAPAYEKNKLQTQPGS